MAEHGFTPGPWRVDDAGDIVSGPYNVVAALDKYNAENGTHLGGPPFFKIGVALAKARAAITLATGKDA